MFPRIRVIRSHHSVSFTPSHTMMYHTSARSHQFYQSIRRYERNHNPAHELSLQVAYAHRLSFQVPRRFSAIGDDANGDAAPTKATKRSGGAKKPKAKKKKS